MLQQMGKRIQQARTQQKMTQKQLAQALGVDRVSVSEWESGKYGIHVSLLPRLAQILNVPITFFFDITPTDNT